MNPTEVRDIAAGLDYVIRQTKNRELAKDALNGLYELHNSVKHVPKLDDLIANYIEYAEAKIGVKPSEATELLEMNYNMNVAIYAFLAYFVFLLIAAYNIGNGLDMTRGMLN